MVTSWKGEHQAYNQAIDGVHSFADVAIPSDPVGQLNAYNQVTTELQGLIASAVANGKTLRAYGSSWSLSKCGVSDHQMLNTAALTIGLRPGPTHFDAAYPVANRDKLRFLECGVSIAAINEYLLGEQLSLKASGSNSGQALAGVVSTGTHGSAFKFGACQDFVVGLHLVLGPTKHVYLQRHSSPVVNQSWADKFGATLVNDDKLFNAALVSFGSFGIIHGIMVETRERFLLRAYRRIDPLDVNLWNAIGSLDFSGINLPKPENDLYHFEVFFNPNAGTPPNEAIVMLMFEEGWHPYTPPVWHTGSGGLAILYREHRQRRSQRRSGQEVRTLREGRRHQGSVSRRGDSWQDTRLRRRSSTRQGGQCSKHRVRYLQEFRVRASAALVGALCKGHSGPARIYAISNHLRSRAGRRECSADPRLCKSGLAESAECRHQLHPALG
jgi:hypothetical protein